MKNMTRPIEFWDPHFHIFDVSEKTTSGHDPAQLFEPDDDPLYTVAKYERDCEVAVGFDHIGGAWLEALSVCHVGQTGRDYIAHCLAESRWTAAELRKSDRHYVMVPTVPLEEPTSAEALEQIAAEPMVRGIRQILNHRPDWPRNTLLGDLLDNPDWRRGYAELQVHGLSFDLQLNPRQYIKAARFIQRHPEIPVIINHLGSPLLTDLTENVNQFRTGIEALAACANTSIKISMLYYAAPDWDRQPAVRDAIHFVIDTFGPDRCFFASNYPVDIRSGWPADRLFPALQAVVADRYDEETVRDLFSTNARRAYRAE